MRIVLFGALLKSGPIYKHAPQNKYTKDAMTPLVSDCPLRLRYQRREMRGYFVKVKWKPDLTVLMVTAATSGFHVGFTPKVLGCGPALNEHPFQE